MPPKPKQTSSYSHPEAESLMRPEVGTQAQFRKKKPARRYRYDSSLAPELSWDGQNGARELGEWLLGLISKYANGQQDGGVNEFKDSHGAIIYSIHSLQEAAELLRRISQPFLNWTGKAERLSFDVPTLPLFVHERLSTQAILETLKGHRRNKQLSMFDLFADPQHSVTDQVLRAYEYKDGWTNRMILGDSLTVMNSLLQYESLGGSVQMIYMDPPYGVKFGSNFQPFVRKRDVKHNDDADLTREPEMVKAYRDTWELGLHSYLTYLRDRLLVARDLLTESGSIFVQISDENVHHVREVMDEVFGAENFVGTIGYKTAIGLTSGEIDKVFDYLVWFAKDKEHIKFHRLFTPTTIGREGATRYKWIESPDGKQSRIMTSEEYANPSLIPAGWRAFRDQGLTSRTGSATTTLPFTFQGKVYKPSSGGWRTNLTGLEKLASENRILVTGNNISYKKYYDDFPALAMSNLWSDTSGGITSRADPKIYAVQTSTTVIERCVLMTTDPGDLVVDPTCGSGATAYVAEEWGRRWITMDVSRVPLALARQRLLSATFPYYELMDESRGPAGGFIYKRRQNNNGDEVGGIVPHVTLGSIAKNEPPEEEVLVDRPEANSRLTRISGAFVFEATIPTAAGTEAESAPENGDEGHGEADSYGSFLERMIEVLRRSPVIMLGGGKSVALKGVRPPAKSLSLSAEATVESGQANLPVAIVFGPENGAVSERLVYEAAREAHAKDYKHLYVIGFAVESKARQLVENCEDVTGLPATYVQATPDLLMGDLLKNMRSSQIFSVCGLPEIALRRRLKDGAPVYEVELLGLDVFDPITMENEHIDGDDVPAWFLDTDYNGLVFHVSQAFFPRTAAWDSLKRALKGEYEDSVWDHLAGAVSAPFEAAAHAQIAVKVIDDRGNELLVQAAIVEALDA